MAQKNSLTTQVLSIIGGILTAILFVGFMAASSLLELDLSSLIIGLILIIITLSISRLFTAPFLDAMNITLYIAGGILTTYGLHSKPDILFIALAVISILTFLLSKGFILPFLSVILFIISFFGEIIHVYSSWRLLEIGIIPVLAIFLLIHLYEEPLLKKRFIKYKSLHSGLFVSCIGLLGILSVNYWIPSPNLSWMIGLFIIVQRIIKVMEVNNPIKEAGVYAVCIIISLLTLFAPYLSGTLLLILICFHYGYRAECGAALLLFIYAISKYYYDLNLTLLVKSATLFFTGIVFIIAWYYFTQKRTKHEKI